MGVIWWNWNQLCLRYSDFYPSTSPAYKEPLRSGKAWMQSGWGFSGSVSGYLLQALLIILSLVRNSACMWLGLLVGPLFFLVLAYRSISELLVARKHKIHCQKHWCRFSWRSGGEDKGRETNSSWRWHSEVQRPRNLLLRAGQIRMVGHLTSRRRLRLPSQYPLALKFSSIDCRPTHRPAPNSPFWSFQLVSPPLTFLSKTHPFA